MKNSKSRRRNNEFRVLPPTLKGFSVRGSARPLENRPIEYVRYGPPVDLNAVIVTKAYHTARCS